MKEKKIRKSIIRFTAVFLSTFLLLYLTAIYSNIPFIAKYRTLYIETAMSTMTHQWLATSFIPKSVIDAAINQRDNTDIKKGDGSSDFITKVKNLLHLNGREWFVAEFDEINMESFDKYTERNPGILNDGYENILIDNSRVGDDKTGIVTNQGDNVVAIDAKNKILIVEVKGEGYNGRLAVAKDASTVKVGMAEGVENNNNDDWGSQIDELSKYNNAILSINASGFVDADGNGNGGQPIGAIIENGNLINSPVGGNWFIVGFDYNDRMSVGRNTSTSELRDAVEFMPALIIDGVKQVEGSSGWGIQPRTAIGQKANLEVLMLVIDGRQLNYSIGATVGECADIMERYGAVQACNLDGGASSIMYYNNHPVTIPSIKYDVGRWIPNIIMVNN
nr:phosphodiester glycosidase family protein [Sedimentibacter sp.]